ncbi:isocitrate lyase/phosphoenolpyruvate mutase family protein [Streptomyces sp. NPDC086010]|uniref:isocitrate lyase/phosphoenolpyruvate mutase family protein n=1 Tax=Streptomyces sp. NPDC086010 TaxID=3365745 RepID=UPI0037D37F98
MTESAAVFRALHHGRPPGEPVVLPGPWEVPGARVFEEAGFPALATPSAGVAASVGYADGRTPAAEMFAAVSGIARAVSVPVSADVEAGYGPAPDELVARPLEAGAVGCNLEDPVEGVLVEPREQAERLAEVRAAAGGRSSLRERAHRHVRPRRDGRRGGGGHDRPRSARRRGRADCVYPIMAPAEVLSPRGGGRRRTAHRTRRARRTVRDRRLGELGAARVTFGPQHQRRAAEAVRVLADRLDGR